MTLILEQPQFSFGCDHQVIGTEIVEGIDNDHNRERIEYLRSYCVDCGNHLFGVASTWWIWVWRNIFDFWED